METVCLLCRTPRAAGVRRCNCGYVYDTAEPEDPERVVDGMPVYVPTGCFSLLLLLVITGTNATGGVVLAVAGMATILGDGVFRLGPDELLLIFGAVAFGFDLLSRGMLRCSPGDTTRGSQFLKMPVWIIGFFLMVLAVGLLATR